MYQAKLWVFPHLSGVITCRSNGEIQNVNDNLSKHLFGYTSKELRALVSYLRFMTEVLVLLSINIQIFLCLLFQSLFDLIPDLVQNSSKTTLYGLSMPHIEMDSSLEFSRQGYVLQCVFKIAMGNT